MTTERDIRNQIVYARDMGREEGKAETALAMLANGLDIALASKCTGLSEQHIRELQKS